MKKYLATICRNNTTVINTFSAKNQDDAIAFIEKTLESWSDVLCNTSDLVYEIYELDRDSFTKYEAAFPVPFVHASKGSYPAKQGAKSDQRCIVE